MNPFVEQFYDDINEAQDLLKDLEVSQELWINPFIIQEAKNGKNLVLLCLKSYMSNYAGERVPRSHFMTIRHNRSRFFADIKSARDCLHELSYADNLFINKKLKRKVTNGEKLVYAYIKIKFENRDAIPNVGRSYFMGILRDKMMLPHKNSITKKYN